MILIVIVILYYIVMIASMVVARQRGEIVLMRSRGATSFQTFAVFLIEAGTLSLTAALVGPLIAGLAIGFLGYTPAFSELTGGDALPVHISGASYGLSAAGALLAFAALLIPAVQASRVGIARVSAGGGEARSAALVPEILCRRCDPACRAAHVPASCPSRGPWWRQTYSVTRWSTRYSWPCRPWCSRRLQWCSCGCCPWAWRSPAG